MSDNTAAEHQAIADLTQATQVRGPITSGKSYRWVSPTEKCPYYIAQTKANDAKALADAMNNVLDASNLLNGRKIFVIEKPPVKDEEGKPQKLPDTRRDVYLAVPAEIAENSACMDLLKTKAVEISLEATSRALGTMMR